jgi:hypothetical protein
VEATRKKECVSPVDRRGNLDKSGPGKKNLDEGRTLFLNKHS